MFPRGGQEHLPAPCLDRFINGVCLGGLARVLGSSQSAYLWSLLSSSPTPREYRVFPVLLHPRGLYNSTPLSLGWKCVCLLLRKFTLCLALRTGLGRLNGRGRKGKLRDVRVKRVQSIRKPGFAWAHLHCVLVQRFNFSLSRPRNNNSLCGSGLCWRNGSSHKPLNYRCQ